MTLILAGALAGSAAVAASRKSVKMPTPDEGVANLASWKAAQERAARGWRVFHDFRFRDRLPESGITFVQRPTDDSGKFYKPNHYDHGTGLAAADVDGDGLVDLYFVNQLGGNELWRNRGGGRFENVTRAAGVGLADRIGVTASFADVDNDGDADLYVTSVRGGNVLFENDGKGRFRDVTKAAGLEYSGHSSGAVFFDFDNDGRLDLFLVNVGRYTTDEKGRGGYFVGFSDAFAGHQKPDRTERCRLYRNLGQDNYSDGGPQPVGTQFETGFSGDATFTDLDGDGFADLYVLNMQGDDHFLANEGGKRFVEKTVTYSPKTPWGTMGVKFFADLRQRRPDGSAADGHALGHERGDRACGGEGQVAHAVDGLVPPGRREQRVREPPLPEPGRRPLRGGVRRDRCRELLAVGSERRRLQRRRVGGRVHRVGDGIPLPLRRQLAPPERPRPEVRRRRVPPGDRAASRRTDQRADVRRGLHNKEGAGRKACIGQKGPITVLGTLSTRSAVIFDLDGDGDLDFVTNEFNAPPQVFVSDLAAKRRVRFLQVHLVGGASDTDGLGAAVRVHAGSATYSKYNDGKSGYLSQSILPLYFGLGSAEKADRVEVLWPSKREIARRAGHPGERNSSRRGAAPKELASLPVTPPGCGAGRVPPADDPGGASPARRFVRRGRGSSRERNVRASDRRGARIVRCGSSSPSISGTRAKRNAVTRRWIA